MLPKPCLHAAERQLDCVEIWTVRPAKTVLIASGPQFAAGGLTVDRASCHLCPESSAPAGPCREFERRRSQRWALERHMVLWYTLDTTAVA